MKNWLLLFLFVAIGCSSADKPKNVSKYRVEKIMRVSETGSHLVYYSEYEPTEQKPHKLRVYFWEATWNPTFIMDVQEGNPCYCKFNDGWISEVHIHDMSDIKEPGASND